MSLHVFSDCILLARRKENVPGDQRSFDGLIYIKSLRVDVLSEECIVLNTDKVPALLTAACLYLSVCISI